jgi:hypothetical protein
MAFTVTNHGIYYLLNTAITSPDIRMVVFKGTVPAASSIRAWDFVSEAIASTLDESTGGYTRPDLASVTLTKEPSGANSVTLTAASPTIPGAQAPTGETWVAVGYYVHTGSDATGVLLGIDTPTPPNLATNGADVTMPALLITITGS